MANQNIFRGTTTFGAAAAGDSFYILEGFQPITGNTDYSGQNTSVTAEINKGYLGTIGTASDPWKTAFSTRLVHMGGGTLYFESNAADTETTALLQLLGAGNIFLSGSGAIITRAEGMAGLLNVGAAVTTTNLRVSGSCTCQVLDAGAGPTVVLLETAGGTTYTRRPHTTINGLAGKITLDADTTGAVNAHGTVNAYGAKFLIHDSGTITTLNYQAGFIDLSKLTRLLTITNTNINMSLPWAQAFLDHPLVTFTNTPTRYYSDGRPL